MKKQTKIQYLNSLSAIVFLVSLLLFGWFLYLYMTRPKVTEFVDNIFVGTDDMGCKFRSVLNGVCVDGRIDVTPELIAVMVENHVDSRPQSGLVDADVVYEAPVEGNFSRFLLLFPRKNEVSKVGPVRSARPYYLDWVSEFGDPMYMYVGGSNEALEKIKKINIFDVNEFNRGWFFWRSKDRFAPHNTYTSSDLWNKAWIDYANNRGETSSSTWAYGDLDICVQENGDCIDDITIQFNGLAYESGWKFNSSTLQYERYQSRIRHIDFDLRPIVADTVIVQHVESSVLDEVGRLAIETQGSGSAEIFRDGHKIIGTWMKNSQDQKTRWLGADGNDIQLKPGKIWIEVANGRSKVEYK